jgi:hypothetical protein
VPEIVGGEVFVGATSFVVDTTSWGRRELVASRLLSEMGVVVADVSAKLTEPLAAMSGVTSTAVQAPEANGPEEPVMVPATGGAFAYVIVVSLQLLLATLRTSYPTVEPLDELRRSVAFVTVPLRP